jgi:hypothetical protein
MEKAQIANSVERDRIYPGSSFDTGEPRAVPNGLQLSPGVQEAVLSKEYSN